MVKRMLILCGLLLAASAYLAWAKRPSAVPDRASVSDLPLALGTWRGQDLPPISDRIMSNLGVDDYIDRAYVNFQGAQLELYIGYYLSQSQNDSIHSPLNCLPGAGWNPVRREHLQIAVGDRNIDVNRIAIRKGLQESVVLYWYHSHGRAVANEYWAKFYTVADAMRTGRTDAALVRITCPTRSLDAADEEEAGRLASEFAQLLYPYLSRYVPD